MVASIRHGEHPQRERRCGPAAAAPGRLGLAIDVEGPRRRIESLRSKAKFRRVGLANDDIAGFLDAFDKDCVFRRNESP